MKITEIGAKVLDFILNHLRYIAFFLLVIASFSILYSFLSEFKSKSLPTEAAPFNTTNIDNYKRDTFVIATIGENNISYQNKYGEFSPEEKGIYTRYNNGGNGPYLNSWEDFNKESTVYIRAYPYLDKLKDNIPSSLYADHSKIITDNKLFNITFNTSDWEKNRNGWWYYKKPLKIGELSSPLFNKIYASADTRAFLKENCGVNLLVEIEYYINNNDDETYKDAFKYTKSKLFKETE